MSRTCSLALLGGLCLASLAHPAVAPPIKPWERQAARLIEQLGDRDYRAREAAEQGLSDLGLVVVPMLRSRALGHRDAQVRVTAARLVSRLENDAALAPKHITAKLDKRKLSEVFAEITKQTGYQVTTVSRFAKPGPDTLFSFDFRKATFWEAIDEIGKAAHMVVATNYGDPVVRLEMAGGHSRFAGQDGSFRFVANGFNVNKNIDFGTIGPRGEAVPARSEALTFTFTLFAEPRFPFMNTGDPRLDAAYDNERHSLVPSRDAGPEGPGGRLLRTGRYYGGMRQNHIQASLQLAQPSPKATHVKLLRGAVPVTLLLSQRPLIVTDKLLEAKGQTFTADNARFRFESVEKQGADQYSVKVTVNRIGDFDPQDYSWSSYVYQRVEVQDAAGNKYQPWGSGISSMGPSQVQLQLQYRPPIGLARAGPPAKFVYTSWTTRQHHVPFEFRDLPLP